MRRILKALLYTALGSTALAGLALALVPTPVGERLIQQLANDALDLPEGGARLEGLSISWSGDVSLARLTLTDPSGPYATLSGVALDWRPLALLTGEVRVNSLSAATIDLQRRPQPAAAPAEPSPRNGGLQLPVASLRLDHLDLPDIQLGAAVAGEPVRLAAKASGAANALPETFTGKLDVTRIDGTAGALNAEVTFAPAAGTLAFQLRANEPRGGLIARLAGIEDLPALDLDLNGSGPLTDWSAQLALALDGRPTASGTARLSEAANSERRLTVDLGGDLAPLAPPVAGAVLAGQTQLAATIELAQDFSARAGTFKLTTGTLAASGTASLDPASQVLAGELDARLAAEGDALIGIDTGSGLATLKSLTASAKLDGTLDRATWHASLEADALNTPSITLPSARLDATGVGASLRPGALSLPVNATLRIAGLAPSDPRLALFSGTTSADVTGRLAVEDGSAVFRLARASATLPVLSLQIGESEIRARQTRLIGDLRIPDLSSLAPLAGKPLSGGLGAGFRSVLDLTNLTGAVTLSLAGTDLATGTAALDGLLSGKTQATGELTLDQDGTASLRNLSLLAPGVSVTGTAEMKLGDGDGLDGEIRVTLPDLSRLDPRLGGSLTAEADLSGALERPGLELTATSTQILLSGTPLTDLSLALSGEADPEAPRGELNLSAKLNGAPLVARGEVSSNDGRAELTGFEAAVGGNRLSGELTVADLTRALESVSGTLAVNAPDLSELSPLALTALSGRLTAQAAISADAKGPRIRLTAEGAGVGLPQAAVDSVKVDADLFDLTAVPQASGTVSASGLLAGGTRLASLAATAKSDGTRTDFTLDARLPGSAKDGVAAAGSLAAVAAGFDLTLSRLDGTYSGLKTSLLRPARLSYANAIARLDEVALALGNGSFVIQGTAGETLNLSGTLKSVPVALANAFSPGLGLAGTLSGSVKVSGAASAPVASWQLTGAGLSAAALASNGIAPLGLDSRGSFQGQRIEQTSKVIGDGGLSLTATGPVNIAGAGSLALDVSGSVPLALARPALTRSGFRGEGALAVSGRIGGTFAAPDYALTARPQGVSFTELSSGFTLRDVTGSIDVTRDRIVVNGITAAIAAGGTVKANGSIGLSQGMPADLAITVDNGRYSDGRIVTADIGAALKVSGPLAGGGLLSGTVNVKDANIAIPQSLPGSLSPLAVRHVNAPKPVREQVAELKQDMGETGGGSGSGGLSLDVTVNAPARIFVRGRGLDAELGGSLRIVGTTAQPQAIGGIALRRGQLDVLTRRLAFSQGSVTFTGSLTPTLNFVATTTASSTTINVTISGSAADPVIALSSSPSLPQDEILAQLLFDKSMTSLSPTQIAQLAAAVATLTGGSDQGPLAQLRKSLGLDAVDLNVAGPGGPSLSVGKYINDNIYLGVEQGTGRDSSKVKVDIDLSRNLKARGEVGATGSSKAGIYFEKEY